MHGRQSNSLQQYQYHRHPKLRCQPILWTQSFAIDICRKPTNMWQSSLCRLHTFPGGRDYWYSCFDLACSSLLCDLTRAEAKAPKRSSRDGWNPGENCARWGDPGTTGAAFRRARWLLLYICHHLAPLQRPDIRLRDCNAVVFGKLIERAAEGLLFRFHLTRSANAAPEGMVSPLLDCRGFGCWRDI
jgi:hypothetical protein